MTLPPGDVIIGVDESGTGAWAGPFYLAAVVGPRGWALDGVRDSKKTTAAQRLKLVERIEACTVEVVHTEAPAFPDDIEKYGHAGAYLRAFEEVLREALRLLPVPRQRSLVVVDGTSSVNLRRILEQLQVPFLFLKKADQKVQHVSAASIFAKFNRDVEMNLLDKAHPEYKFGSNAGYGTPEHIAAIRQHGLVPHVHRPLARTRG